MTKRVFDCVTFFNEIEILKIRLYELYDHVDYFVICEGTKTFQGAPKELTFGANKDTFARFMTKIIYLVVDDFPENATAWEREYHQRNALLRGVRDASPSDIIVISDVDEIIRPSSIDFMREEEGYFMLDMPMYQFFLNMCAVKSGWNKAFAYSYSLNADIPDLNVLRRWPDKGFAKFQGKNHRIADAGWHFTFMGGAEAARTKLRSYAHTGGHYDEMRKEGVIEEKLRSSGGIGAGFITRFCEIDRRFPRYVVENRTYFETIGYIKPMLLAILELEDNYEQAMKRVSNLEAKWKDLFMEANSLRAKAAMAVPGSVGQADESRPTSQAEEEIGGAAEEQVEEARLATQLIELRRGLRRFIKQFGRPSSIVRDGAPSLPRQDLLEQCQVLVDRVEILKRLPRGGKFAEVGTLFGDFAVKVIEIDPSVELHLFDRSFAHIRPENRRILELHGRAHYHEGDSSNQLFNFPDCFFDIVYVDGDHSYKGVMKDLEQAVRIVKPGGHIVCNDYTNWDPGQAMPYGVFSAVNNVANAFDLRFIYLALQQSGFHDVCLRRS